MKKTYLVHGWGGNSRINFFDWLKKELPKHNIKVYAFDMPNTNEPKIEDWVKFLKENTKNIDKETFFVGHSIGCQAILRFLEKVPEEVKISGVIFVAGWFNLKNLEKEEMKIAKPWLENPIDFKKVKMHTKNFLAIFSDNDPYVPLSDSNLFRKNLNAEIIIKNSKEHLNNVDEIKEVLEFILR